MEANRELLATVKQIAPKNVTLLIPGETGAGKELVASLIHGTGSSALPLTPRSSVPTAMQTARGAGPQGSGGRACAVVPYSKSA